MPAPPNRSFAPPPAASGGSPWDWLQAPAFRQNSLPPELMARAGITPTSRLAAIGQALIGFGQGANSRAGQGGLLSGLAGGLSGAAGGLAGAQQNERQQTMDALLQQAQIAKLLRGEAGETSEFERLVAGFSPEEKAKAVRGRVESLSTENRPPTWTPASPEQRAQGIVQVSDRGEFKYAPAEQTVSPVEAARLRLDELSLQASMGNAAATRQLAQAQQEYARAQREGDNAFRETQMFLAESEREFSRQNKERDDVANLRKEFDSKPEVQNYKVILPTYKSALEANNARGPGSDLEFVYAVGKILDPASAVREGEQAAIANSQSPANILSGFVDWIQGGNRLTEEQRNQLLQIMDRRSRQAYDIYRGTADTFQGYAKESYGVDPTKVVRDLGSPPPLPKMGGTTPSVAAGMPMAPAVTGLADEVWP